MKTALVFTSDISINTKNSEYSSDIIIGASIRRENALILLMFLSSLQIAAA